jgi:endonuclease/exonuclease/phosphatase family metal-dependent hydrolase
MNLAGTCFRLSLLGALLGGFAPVARSADEFSLMTYNVMRFSYEDRDKDGQKDNFKPAEQLAALMTLLKTNSPDVLALQEIGDAASFAILTQSVAQAGLDYPHHEYFIMPQSTVGLAVLSRFPIVGRHPIDDETYSIGSEKLPVQRGFLNVDIQVNPDYRFRLLVAHLKSKLYHPLGQTEMRRNEARLLNKNVRRMLNKNPDLNLVVVGDMNDSITSAALRELIGSPACLVDLRPKDYVNDLWTHFWAYQESYERLDYILVSAGMQAEVLDEKCRVVRDPLTYVASDHRPVVAVFKAADQPRVEPAADSSDSSR